MSFKKIVLFIHRWLGLLTGLLVLLLSLTGCLFVFHHEISQWVRHDTYFADAVPADGERLPISELQRRAVQALEVESLPYGITTYKDPERNWSAMYYEGGVDSWTYFGSMEAYKTAYINPYTGAVESIVNEKRDFFQIMKGLHWSLLLATPIGQPIVVWGTLLFIVLLLSGMVLWWPKKWNRAGRQKSFRIKWGASWRRVNYDLHNVVGFYFLLLSLAIAFTGLYWYFPFAKKSLHFLGTGEYRLPAVSTARPTSAPADSGAVSEPMEIAYSRSWKAYPSAYSITLASPSEPKATIRATVRPDGQTYYSQSYLQFDRYTGQLLSADRYSEKNAGEKLVAMNYDIHVGAIGGLPGKIIAFLASLACGSLPVTGFIIWLDREKRKRTASKRKRPELTVPSDSGTR